MTLSNSPNSPHMEPPETPIPDAATPDALAPDALAPDALAPDALGTNSQRPDAQASTLQSLGKTLLLIAPFFLWGTAMVAMKGVIPHTTPLFIATVRLFPAGILVLVVAWLLGRSQPQTWQAWAWITAFGLVDGAMFQGFLAEGLERTGAGLGSVMIDSQPIAVALMARFLFGERIGLWGFLGLGFGLIGISLLGLPDAWIMDSYGALIHGQFSSLLTMAEADVTSMVDGLFHNGEWLMLLAALSMAVGTIMIRYVSKYVDPIVATGWHMIIGGVVVFALSYQTEFLQYTFLTLPDWIALGYASIFGGAIAYGLFFFFASQGNLTSLIALTFLTPVFALLFGYGFLGEVLSPLQGTGVCLTIVSIYLINQRTRLESLFAGKDSTTSHDPPTHQDGRQATKMGQTNAE